VIRLPACYRVLIHGALEPRLTRNVELSAAETMPAGFYATRYVAALDPASAGQRAIRSVRRAIEARYPALRTGTLSVTLTDEEVEPGRWRDMLRAINRGFNFYLKE
jgi:hypothetical protein